MVAQTITDLAHAGPREVPRDDSTTFRDALLAARDHSADALLAMADALTATVNDSDEDFPGPVGRLLAGERLRAITDELARRERLSRIAAGVASPADRRYQAWRDLARLLRDRIDIVDVFDRAGYLIVDATPTEAHAACPICGGRDRLVIRRDPPGRAWCRRCEWGGDLILVTMSIVPGCGEFRDAIIFLADLAGLQVPR
jgi:hypothetical protein